MTDADGHLHPNFAFERHPASIERHAGPPPAVPVVGFDAITTWSPHMLAGPDVVQDAVPAPVLPAPEPAAPLAEPVDPPQLPDDPPEPAEPETSWVEADQAEVTETTESPDPALEHAPAAPRLPSLLRQSASGDPAGPGLWDGSLVPARPLRSGLPRWAAGVAFAAVVAGLVLAGARYLPGLLGASQAVTAVFNAPMMVVRSAVAGRVTTVAAAPSQLVDPKSPLLTIRTDDGKEDRPVLAGVHGMVRSVETVPGAALVAGAPLVRLQDCDRAFLTVPPAAKLQAGQSVQVTMPDQKPLVGRVRVSSGVMEPPDSLVIGLDPGVLTASCPVGRSASVTPVQG